MAPALLDTDTLSELIKLRNIAVQQRAVAYTQQCGPLTFSTITRYEILRGYKQQRASAQLARFATFCQHSVILPLTDAVIDIASDLWAYARLNGHPHDDADLLIAATALDQQRVLATGNLRHFTWVPNLPVEDWRTP
jgi:tRNA(fMet)-specific endonuclease VapC